MEQLVANLERDPSDLDSTRKLGDLFRDSAAREDALEKIPRLTSIFVGNLKIYEAGNDPELILEDLRVVINLLADNDANRLSFIEENEFWLVIKEILTNIRVPPTVKNRIGTLFNQFIYNSEVKAQLLEKLFNLNIISTYLTWLEQIQLTDTVFDLIPLFEFVREVIKSNMKEFLLRAENVDLGVRYVDAGLKVTEYVLQLEDEDLDDIDEILLLITEVISSMTSFETMLPISSINANERVLNILPQVPDDLPNKTHIKRKLFAISGNISSMGDFKSKHDLEVSLAKYIDEGIVDPYVMAASAINLGNFIINSETAKYVEDLIQRSVEIEQFFNIFFTKFQINDVVQIQAIHLINNLLTSINSKYILANYDRILNVFTKVIVDNGKYYGEVLNLYLKFIKKLIRCQFMNNKDDIMNYYELWEILFAGLEQSLIDLHEIKLLLLQAYIQKFHESSLDELAPEKITLLRNLIHSTVGLTNTTNLPDTLLFEKLKTIGIFTHTLNSNKISPLAVVQYVYDNDEELFKSQFQTPMFEFLLQLKEQLQIARQQPQYAMLANNSKFVCGTTLTFFDQWKDGDQVIEVCKEINREN